MKNQGQTERLTHQQKDSSGVVGIFGKEAQLHDFTVGEVAAAVLSQLRENFPKLEFRHRNKVMKDEINQALQEIDSHLGQTLFVQNACVIPDGGIIEVKDDNEKWRIVLVSEAKYQGKDIENIQCGKLVGKNNDQDLMSAGNAIERSHKNISEISNLMLGESHFPYLLFLEGSNFLTKTISIKRPDGREVILEIIPAY